MARDHGTGEHQLASTRETMGNRTSQLRFEPFPSGLGRLVNLHLPRVIHIGAIRIQLTIRELLEYNIHTSQFINLYLVNLCRVDYRRQLVVLLGVMLLNFVVEWLDQRTQFLDNLLPNGGCVSCNE